MAKWFYYNEQGDKIEVAGRELKELAKAGMITRDTIVETEEGKQAPARRVKGLTFAETVQPKPAPEIIPPEPSGVNPFTAAMPVAQPTTAPAPMVNQQVETSHFMSGQPTRKVEEVLATFNLEGYQTQYKDIFNAAKKGTVQDVAYFIKNGVSSNAQTEKGQFEKGIIFYPKGSTPLYLAVDREWSGSSVMQFLLEVGTDVNIQADDGTTALDMYVANSLGHVILWTIGVIVVFCALLFSQWFGIIVGIIAIVGIAAEIPWFIDKRKKRSILRNADAKRGKEIISNASTTNKEAGQNRSQLGEWVGFLMVIAGLLGLLFAWGASDIGKPVAGIIIFSCLTFLTGFAIAAFCKKGANENWDGYGWMVFGAFIVSINRIWHGNWVPFQFSIALALLCVAIYVVINSVRNGWESMPAKQRCNIISGILIPVGLVLCLIAWNMNSHNNRLIADYEHTHRISHSANQNLERMDVRVESLENMQQAMKETSEIARRAIKADEELRFNAYSPGMITMLFVLGSFSFFTGCVLVIVGMVIPENKP